MSNIVTDMLNIIMASAKYYEENMRPENAQPKSPKDWKKLAIGDALGMCCIVAAADGKSTMKEISTADTLLGTQFSIDRFFNDYSIVPDDFFNLFFREHVQKVKERYDQDRLPVSVENFIDTYYHARCKSNGKAELTETEVSHLEKIVCDYISMITVVAQADKKIKQSELDVLSKFGSIYGKHVSKVYNSQYSFDENVAKYIERLKEHSKYYPNK